MLAMLKREVSSKYQQSLIGFVWLLLQPLFLLFIYYFVFAYVFKIRFAVDASDATAMPYTFVTFLAVGLWPWSALSEGLNAATGSIDKHKGVLQKIALPAQLLVLVEVLVPYIIHGLGFLCVLIILALALGENLAWSWLPLAMLLFFVQCVFSVGIGLMLASMQVFLKDIAQLLQPLLMILFYGSPVLYPPSINLPESLMSWLRLNPFSAFVNAYRAMLLEGRVPDAIDIVCVVVFTLLAWLGGQWLFRRLSVRFEDMY